MQKKPILKIDRSLSESSISDDFKAWVFMKFQNEMF